MAQVDEHVEVPEVAVPREVTEALHPPATLGPALCISSVWLLLSWILYSKPANVMGHGKVMMHFCKHVEECHDFSDFPVNTVSS